ncbi:hypothetical protein P280DRAFT_408010 [Massarina eburnea CBS 473.64]|uniref:BHLH domain-containing protein n=1 Tax=Massarina eburnea CBS 473.64 TaxID=1395130 RepID=A0A6A6RP86_9PLEO|nr:hypothetical protein P280DRAFT_408010 [Massarina eburnea CBS 473.64]
MSRPSFPPTPAPSADITGKNANVGQFDSNFALPPAAMGASKRRSTETSSTTSNASDSSYRPPSPASPVATSKAAAASQKRSSAGGNEVTSDDYSLPPPPTRSRKIIQMKPKESPDEAKTTTPASSAKPAPATTSGKRKQAGGATAAGRKTARKTAHSLIERRRRSKMNEEFGVLKDMIPACTGQDMHKLAILQASIEYMRYLQQCVNDLKEAHRSSKPTPPDTASLQTERPPPTFNSTMAEGNGEEEDEGEDDEDEEMSDAVSPNDTVTTEPKRSYRFSNASPATYPSDRTVHSTTTSPNIYPGDVQSYSVTASPAIHPSDPHRYSLGASSIRSTATSPSIQASPVFGSQTPSQPFHNPFSAASSSKKAIPGSAAANFTLTSPALGPQADREDHEATEALLMLNTDRRSWNTRGRGMSVKDLLSG